MKNKSFREEASGTLWRLLKISALPHKTNKNPREKTPGDIRYFAFARFRM